MRSLYRAAMFGMLALGTLPGCADRRGNCVTCTTLVVGATGEPSSLMPPLVVETVGRDISDLVFERLADLAPGGSPLDPQAYRPRLAARWERVDSTTWRFHLRPGARWHDGRPVTADDVAFSFDAYADSIVDAGARPSLAGKVRAVAEDAGQVRIEFATPSPEQLYDATYHVRILPKHVWDAIPRERWASDTALAHLVGSGPYRVRRWTRGESVELEADTSRRASAPGYRRVVWRFAADPEATLNLLLAHEVDVLETVGTADQLRRVAADTTLQLVSYPSAVYGFLAFRLGDRAGRPHPALHDREVRRALVAAVDRAAATRAVFGTAARVPPGPMSQGLWIWDDAIRAIPFDSAGARRALDRASARGQLGRIDILVPATSQTRRQLALVVQEAWRRVGVDATITVVDFPVFQERLAEGRFDSYIGVYLDEPSPRGLAEQWSRAGWDALNYGHYTNPRFDTLLARATREPDLATARVRWREAMDTLNADAPAIFLYTLTNTAAVRHGVANVTIDPYSWASTLPSWSVDSTRDVAARQR